MNRKLLPVLIVLSLSACATPSSRDDSPASDLAALEASVTRDLQPTLLPNGKEYCAELANTTKQQETCMGNLEDAVYQGNRDKARAAQNLRLGLRRVRLAQAPCRWYQVACRREARSLPDP